jgi:PPOX class probable FMN-dependent enzyme
MIESEDELRELYEPPLPLVTRKTLDHLDQYCAMFIARSPFLCLATSDADGRCDVSPRGDPPGFVAVLDPKTLLIPDRKGNNRLDSASNVLTDPGVGLLFFIPGIDDTLRVNGLAAIVDDEAALAPLAVRGAVPKTALRVTVEEAFIHCGRALKRSRLWDPGSHADREEIPPIGVWLRDQAAPDAAEEELIEKADAADLY